MKYVVFYRKHASYCNIMLFVMGGNIKIKYDMFDFMNE